MGLNPITPAGRAPELLGTLGLFLGLSTITTALRVYCRTFVVKNFGVDDWLALLAYMIFVLYSSFAILGCYHGTGQHADNIPLDVLPHGLKVCDFLMARFKALERKEGVELGSRHAWKGVQDQDVALHRGYQTFEHTTN